MKKFTLAMIITLVLIIIALGYYEIPLEQSEEIRSIQVK